ncbi:cation:proton antiporter subunit C [Mycobacterium sp. smrl_JER01]|uniref:cation:proton antiporter subunit C n=1 Tax=Mycobacterium sp. smrl_JER01 TaxID=3402633 RepID=UPI003AC119CB
MTVALTVGILVAGAVYLFVQREMLRVILGFILLSHAANLALMAAGGTSRRGEPFGTPEDTATIADPLPQAFVLTAIVIAFSITVFMLVLAVTGHHDHDGTDDADCTDDPDGSRDPDSAGSEAGAGDPAPEHHTNDATSAANDPESAR